MAKRVSASYKASGVNSTQGNQRNTVFFYVEDGAADAAILAFLDNVDTLMNGSRTGVSIQIDEGQKNPPYASATANGGSDRATVLLVNDNKHQENVTLPFFRQNKSKADIEAVFEAHAELLVNRDDEPLGQVVNIKLAQIVDG